MKFITSFLLAATVIVFGTLFDPISNSSAELLILKYRGITHCISNDNHESPGLSWILPPNYDLNNQIKSHWIEARNKNVLTNLACDINKEKCKEWKKGGKVVKNTQVENVQELNFGPVTDFRWNQIPMRKSSGITNNFVGQTDLTYATDDTSMFHLSVLAKSDAEILLSETKNYNTNVFFIVLGNSNNSGMPSEIISCSPGQNYRHTTECKTTKANYTQDILHKGTEWIQFTMQITKQNKNDKYIRIQLMYLGNKIFNWEGDKYFAVNHVSFSSHLKNPAYWQFLEYNILAPATEAKVSIAIYQHSESLCLSIIYYSTGDATLQRRNGTTIQNYTLKSGKTWQIERFQADQLEPDNYEFKFIFDKKNKFYLGHVRVCNKEQDIFMSTLEYSNAVKCVDLKSKKSVEYKEAPNLNKTYSCKNYTFGRDCKLTCKLLKLEAKDCHEAIVCDEDNNCFNLIPGDKVEENESKDDSTMMIVIIVVSLIIIVAVIVGFLFWKRSQRMPAEDRHIIHYGGDTIPDTGVRNAIDNQLLPPNRIQRSTSPQQNGTNRGMVSPSNVLIPTSPQHQAPPIPQSKKPSIKATGDTLSYPVRVQDLEEYIDTSLVSGELQRQHALSPRGQRQPWDYGKLPVNKPKNRYGNLIAYDASRVKLAFLHGDPSSDYINANYIDGYRQPKTYIATQGPKPNTVIDFWRMVWQENICVIVMLANLVESGKSKSEKYWPNIPRSLQCGDITIQPLEEVIYADYTFRTFNIHCQGQIRSVTQLHFTAWPDHGAPCYPQTVSTFIKNICKLESSAPILVHCSAGVGRTGVIILAHSCLKMAEDENQVDPLALLHKIRTQRVNLVDTSLQYEYMHLVLLDILLTENFSVPCTNFVEHYRNIMVQKAQLLQQEYAKVDRLCKRDIMRIKNNKTESSWPKEKSRYPDIVPGSYGRVELASPEGGSEFINAVYVDGFRVKNQFIATQLPLPTTVADLWFLVAQTGASLILVLNKPEPIHDQSTCNFWPPPIAQGMKLPDFSYILTKSQVDLEYFTHLELQHVTSTPEKDIQKDVDVLLLHGWQSGVDLPTNLNSLIELWEEAVKRTRGSGPIIVMCHDGAKACGLFIASVFVMEKIELESEVDVGLAVRTIRLTRPHFITSIEQYQYLYELALKYQDNFQTYSNLP